jgi:hypothetical protein
MPNSTPRVSEKGAPHRGSLRLARLDSPGRPALACGWAPQGRGRPGGGNGYLIGFTISERIRRVVLAAVFRSMFIVVAKVMSATRAQVLPSAQTQTG